MRKQTMWFLNRLDTNQARERGRASDSEWGGPGFDPHKRHCVVSLQDSLTPYITG